MKIECEDGTGSGFAIGDAEALGCWVFRSSANRLFPRFKHRESVPCEAIWIVLSTFYWRTCLLTLADGADKHPSLAAAEYNSTEQSPFFRIH